MAKDLPYFKFFCSEWNDGNITLEDYKVQGVFINVCSYYWSKECILDSKTLYKRFKDAKEEIDILMSEGYLKTENNDIVINFLIEQKEDREETSRLRSKGGKASAEARRLKKLQQETNKDSTQAQHVLKSCSTETQLLREEKRREEKKTIASTKVDTKDFSDEIKNLYKKLLPLFDVKDRPKSKDAHIKWADALDKLNRLDGYTFKEIENSISWAKKDEFWNRQIISLASLRKTSKNGVSKFRNMYVCFEPKKPKEKGWQPNPYKSQL